MAQFPSYSCICVIVSLLFLVVNYVVIAQPTNGTQTILIVFGDSTVDPGNNDYTGTWDRSNMWPYGIDFPDHIATGRFSNGRLVTDFAAAYLSGTNRTIKAYLDPNLSLEDLMQGVSFASAGSGYDPEAAQVDGALNLTQQLDNFRKYKTRLEAAIGAEATQTLIYKAIFILSSSTNDFFDYAFNLTGRRQQLTVSNYQQFLLSQFNNFTQALMDEGAKNLFVIGAPPLGHLPEVMTAYAKQGNTTRQPVDSLSAAAAEFNVMLQNQVNTMQASLTNFTIFYGDMYGPITDIVNNPANYGFEVVDRGCCGLGLNEYGMLCALSAAQYGICSNRSAYFFWDAVHPTERGYSCLFEALKPTIEAFTKYLNK